MPALFVFFLLSGSWLLITINSSFRDFSSYDKLFIFASVTFVVALQLLLIAAADTGKNRGIWRHILLTLFAALNFFCLYLSFVADFSKLPVYGQGLSFLFALFIAWQFFASLNHNRLWRQGVVGVCGVLFLIQIGFYFSLQYHTPSAVVVDTTGDKTASDNVQVVRFNKKPNIYFISFDAMLPLALAKKYGLANKLAYQEYVENNGFRRFMNAFSDAPSTLSSLNKVLAMDIDYYHALQKKDSQYKIFTGEEPSPLFQIFKANGYSINTYNRDNYMGGTAGPHIDNYKFNSYFSLCANHPPQLANHIGFFGYCLWTQNQLLVNKFGLYVYDNSSLAPYVNFLIGEFVSHLNDNRPNVFYAYIISPDHTPPDYDHRLLSDRNEYKQKFNLYATDDTPLVMHDIMTFIRNQDPNAYVFFHGDHGPGLSRGFDFLESSQEGQDFFIHDRYGIMSAFYPADACGEYFDAAFPNGYATNSMVIRQIVRCLADGDDPITNDADNYQLHPIEYGYQGDTPGDYADYLYE